MLDFVDHPEFYAAAYTWCGMATAVIALVAHDDETPGGLRGIIELISSTLTTVVAWPVVVVAWVLLYLLSER